MPTACVSSSLRAGRDVRAVATPTTDPVAGEAAEPLRLCACGAGFGAHEQERGDAVGLRPGCPAMTDPGSSTSSGVSAEVSKQAITVAVIDQVADRSAVRDGRRGRRRARSGAASIGPLRRGVRGAWLVDLHDAGHRGPAVGDDQLLLGADPVEVLAEEDAQRADPGLGHDATCESSGCALQSRALSPTVEVQHAGRSACRGTVRCDTQRDRQPKIAAATVSAASRSSAGLTCWQVSCDRCVRKPQLPDKTVRGLGFPRGETGTSIVGG